MNISSSAFEHNSLMPAKYTCDGDDINPDLIFSDIPEEAKSLALIMDDPDVPKSIRADGMWDHWVVFNIPSSTNQILEGQEPAGVHGIGTSGDKEYHGPCPPDREHRYFFKLYALDTQIDLNEGATKIEVEEAMQGHIIDQAELIGLYQRQ
ncbi:YbhB/YbcL family Raf kinase inhibitor-like protein [Patescibacteria group bacterium AH-259-L07]|nr:YbhB/YbcL family Raf kinase inhibitor-like protein [Patescibacteria group bacterium AH-259-L07]